MFHVVIDCPQVKPLGVYSDVSCAGQTFAMPSCPRHIRPADLDSLLTATAESDSAPGKVTLRQLEIRQNQRIDFEIHWSKSVTLKQLEIRQNQAGRQEKEHARRQACRHVPSRQTGRHALRFDPFDVLFHPSPLPWLNP